MMEIIKDGTDALAGQAIGLYWQLIPTLLLGLSPITIRCTRDEADKIRQLGEKCAYVAEWLPNNQNPCDCRSHREPPELCPFDEGTIRMDKV